MDKPSHPSGQRLRAVAGSEARIQVELAHHKAHEAHQRQHPGAAPPIEQVCAELWRAGVVMSLGEALAVVRALGLAVEAVDETPREGTRKLTAQRR